MKSRVYISLLNWNSEKDCLRCVESLQKLDLSNAEITIGIVDNNSAKKSLNVLIESLPKLDILPISTNNGYAAGHLENLQNAKKWNADYFWILNTDTIILPNALEAFLATAKKLGNHIYGSVTLLNDEQIDFGGAAPDPTSLNYSNWHGKSLMEYLELYPESQEVQSVEGSSMFVPMETIETHGFLKTNFFMYGEETDYCLRLKKEGVKSILVSESRIYHYNEGSFVQNEHLKLVPKYYRRRNALRVLMTFFNLSRMEALSYETTPFQIMKAVLKGTFSKKNEAYYLSLANLHAFLGIKGKRIAPEKLLKK